MVSQYFWPRVVLKVLHFCPGCVRMLLSTLKLVLEVSQYFCPCGVSILLSSYFIFPSQLSQYFCPNCILKFSPEWRLNIFVLTILFICIFFHRMSMSYWTSKLCVLLYRVVATGVVSCSVSVYASVCVCVCYNDVIIIIILDDITVTFHFVLTFVFLN